MEEQLSLALAAALASGLSLAFGGIVSFLLDRWPKLNGWWKQLGSDWKPPILFLFMELVAVLPLLLKMAGAPEWLLDAMVWIPVWLAPTWDGFLFALVVGFIAYTASQATYFKVLGRGRDG